MQCESCQQREATIIFTTVVGDEKKTLHLCPQCSRRESDRQAGTESDASAEPSAAAPPAQKVTPTHVAGTKKINVVVGHLAGTETRKGSCPGCGMTYDEFRKVGRLGCAQCYEAFGAPLRRLLKRIHGADTHVGRVPGGRDEAPSATAAADPGAAAAPESVELLRQALQDAVTAEEYERAAELRDRIARLSGGDAS